MAKGNFSNNGRDTFDPLKQYIGIRLQQGVPLLDRDWNELEDIRRYFERMLRLNYIGSGVPEEQGFQITAPPFKAPNDFLIGAGRCLANGYDLYNPKAVLFSEQPIHPSLPAAGAADKLIVYLQTFLERLDSADDPDLANRQDINLETCIRDKLSWKVQVMRAPAALPADAYVLAEINRPAGATLITQDMIVDKRRRWLNLARAVDDVATLKGRVTAAEQRIDAIQLEVAEIKNKLSRLFWDLDVKVPQTQALFGATVQITTTVTDGVGNPVNGAYLEFSTDWGSLNPATAVTNNKGKASISLIGITTETPPPLGEVGILQGVLDKVKLATLSNPGAIQYAQVRFEPQELALLSKYSPSATFSDLSRNLPTGPIVSVPPARTATVTIHAKEGEGAIVRGVGSVQVHFGLWVRDWAKTKVWDVVSRVGVSARVGDLMRQGIVNAAFDFQTVNSKLPVVMQDIQDDTHLNFKSAVFTNPNVDDTELTQTGILGQIIAQEATAAVGSKTNVVIEDQLKKFTSDPAIELDEGGAKTAKTQIVQESSKIAAGFAQSQKQRFSSAAAFRM